MIPGNLDLLSTERGCSPLAFLDVLDGPFTDSSPIFVPDADPFVVRSQTDYLTEPQSHGDA
jgi:hypothetical protein